jgi:hypothetical protein
MLRDSLVAPDTTLRAQVTWWLRSSAAFLRRHHAAATAEDDFDREADQELRLAAGAWLRREELLRAQRCLAGLARLNDGAGTYAAPRCEACWEYVDDCGRRELCHGRDARALLAGARDGTTVHETARGGM